MKKIKKIDDSFFKKIELENLNSIDEIIKNVKNKGIEAVIEYCSKFGDGTFKSENDLKVSDIEIEQALKSLNKELESAIKFAINNIREFAKGQLSCVQNLNMQVDKFPKSNLGHKIIPVENVLCYVPGGNYPLISSAIMGIIPASIAGVKKIMVTSPKITPEVIAASHIAGADEIYKIGGAQAISAFAYGVGNLTKADKIVGPGNKYVTYAKKQVYGECGIDFLAGPSEVLIIADESANYEFVAKDILAQCEHDRNARAYLICKDEEIADEIIKIAEKEIEKLPEIAKIAFENSICFITDNLEEAIEITNKKAPEHLELTFKDAKNYIEKFKNYGSLFIGNYCAEVFGDYCSGTNHTLPTNQVAKYHGGLSVFDFIKIQTYQEIDPDYAQILAQNASILASAEGLTAHKMASEVRRKHEA